jgi:hypothetical protein
MSFVVKIGKQSVLLYLIGVKETGILCPTFSSYLCVCVCVCVWEGGRGIVTEYV